MKKLKRIGMYEPTQQPGKKRNWKALIKPIGAVVVLLVALAIGLNITRIEYLFGKKEPVATVNGAPISMKQFKTFFVESNYGMKDLTGTTAIESLTEKGEIESYMQDSLGGLSDDLVQVAKAKAEGIELTENELTAAEKARSFALTKYKTDEAFQTTLTRVGLTEEEFNKEEKTIYQNSQLIYKLKNKMFDEYKKTLSEGDLVSLKAKSVLMQLGTDKHTDAEIKKAIADALVMMKAGSTVEQVIEKYKDYIYNYEAGKQNGDMGWFVKQDVSDDFWSKVTAVEPGHFTEVIENENACSIVFILDKKTLNVDKLTQTEINNFMNADQFKTWYEEQMKQWKKKFKAYHYINSFELK